jgi:hypothetical protein
MDWFLSADTGYTFMIISRSQLLIYQFAIRNPNYSFHPCAPRSGTNTQGMLF